jgi:hypothetical protein
LQQAAFLTNSPLIDRLLKPTGKNLTARVLELSTNEERVKEIFQNLVGRTPVAEELAECLAYLNEREDRPEAAVRQMEWALLASSEFLLNH